MNLIIEIDRALFLIINGWHNPLIDPIMVLFSAKLPWIPLYLLILFALFFKIRRPLKIERRGLRNSLFYLLGIILLFAITDFGSNQIKYLFERLRPCYDPHTKDIVIMLENRGGLYGFISSHAANVFGLAIFSSLIIRSKRYSIFIFSWAILVSYSRIYVGKHFPLDIIAGALFGIICGWAIYLSIRALIENSRVLT